MYKKSPGRFKFTLKDDFEFNYSIVIDVVYLEGDLVLQVVDSAIAFQAARFLEDMLAAKTFEALKACWIDVYLGLPDMVVHDTGKNFTSSEFRSLAKGMSIEVKEVLVEAYNSVGLVERYHAPLRRVFEIFRAKEFDKKTSLQMAVKAVNDTAGPDGMVPTLLVFGAYPRMTDLSPPSPTIAAWAKALKKAIHKVRGLYTKRKVKDVLAIRNSLDVTLTLGLLL